MVDTKLLKGTGKVIETVDSDVALMGGMRRIAGNMTFQDALADSGNIITLTQLFAGGAAATWVGLTDTVGPIVADRLVGGNAAGTSLELRGVTYQQVQANEPAISGVIRPGELQLSVDGGGIQVGITAGDLGVITRVDALTVTEFISTLASDDLKAPTVANQVSWWVAQDIGLTGTVTIVEFTVEPTVTQLRGKAFLGVSLHSGGTLMAVINAPSVYRDQGQAVNDIWGLTNQTLIRKPGTGIPSEITSTLQIETTDMVVVLKGVGFHPSLGLDPNNSSPITGQSPLIFKTIRGDGTEFNTGLSTFPKTFDNGTIEAPLTGKKAAVTQVAWFADGSAIAQLGKTDYGDYDKAVAAINQERLQNPLWQPARRLAAFLGVAVISNNATTLWKDGEAHFFASFQGGSTVGGVTNWFGLTNTPADGVGKEGFVPTIDSTELELRLGKINTQFKVDVANIVSGPDFANPAQVWAKVFHLERVYLEVKTAPSINLVIDVNVNGTTIFASAKPTINAAALSGSETPTTLTTVKFDALTFDIDSTTDAAWDGLAIHVQGWVEPE